MQITLNNRTNDGLDHHRCSFLLLLLLAIVANPIQLFPQGVKKNIIKITVTEGTNMAASISPDHKTIAIDLQGTIGTVPITGGAATLLTDGMGDERQPTWAPDGNTILFHSYRDGNYHLWTIHKDGSGLKQITFGMYDDREPHWSPDGTRITFSSDRSGNYDIWEMTLSSGELKQRTNDPANDYHPAYSADGKQIAFISVRAISGLYIIDPSGQERLVVPVNGVFNAPAWSPDGKLISFNGLANGNSQLIVATIATGELNVLSHENEDVFPFRATWISDKELIYTSDGKIQRKTLDKQPSKAIPFNVTLTITRDSYTRKQRDFDTDAPQKVLGVFGPVASPDGNSTAFTALGDIWVLKHGDPIPLQLTHGPSMEIDPAWSNDGRMMVFASDRSGIYMNLWVRDFNTGVEKQITTFERHALQPSFSPDGKKIAFLLNDGVVGFGTTTLQVLDVASGEIKSLHKPLFTPGRPTWSADGKLIALSSLQTYSTRFREGLTRILLVPVNGDPVRFVSPVEGRSLGQRGNNGPVWSPDGHTMAYVQDAVLWIVAVDELGNPIHAPKRLTNELAEAPSWSGDGQSLVFIATDRLKKVYVNDGSIENIPCNLEWKVQKKQGQTLIHAGSVFDGRSPSYQKNMDILLDGNRIVEIVPHKTHTSANVIDASDKTVMPGLFESHTHQNGSAGEMLGRNWLAYGITSIRETGGDPYDALERKESWSSGTRLGPREFFTGPLLEGGRIYYELATTVSTGLQLDMELERAVRLDYDFIKTYVRFPDYLQKRATEFAHEHGIPVSSHEIYPAIGYGVDAVEHMSATSRRGYSPKLTAVAKNYDDVVQLLAKSGMNMTATVALYGGFYLKWTTDPDVAGSRQLNALYPKAYVSSIHDFAKAINRTSQEAGERFSEMQRTLQKMVGAGVKITAGTDSPFITYGLSLHVELQNFVEAGLTPYQALRSATILSAEAIGVEKDLGTIEAGKLADLVIVNGDPLKNIKDAWNVEIVFKNGMRYNIEDLLRKQ